MHWSKKAGQLLIKARDHLIYWDKENGLKELEQSQIEEFYSSLQIDSSGKKIIGVSVPKWFVTSIV